jgi:hypothetical protein
VETGNPLSGQKKDYPQPQDGQNPEGSTEDAKESPASGRVAQLWAEMTSLKKGLAIGGVVLIIILIILLALLIVALSFKPKITIKKSADLPMPTTSETVKMYEVSTSK